MIPLESQLSTMLAMVLAGAAVGLLYDCVRAIRWTFRLRGLLVALWDVVFWLAATVVLLVALVAGNWVDLRLYVVLGLGTGLWLYGSLASPVVVRALHRLLDLARRLVVAAVRLLVRAVVLPVGWAWLALAWLVGAVLVPAGLLVLALPVRWLAGLALAVGRRLARRWPWLRRPARRLRREWQAVRTRAAAFRRRLGPFWNRLRPRTPPPPGQPD